MEVRPNSTVDNSSVHHHHQSKQPKPSPVSVDTSSVTQRLQKELMSLMMSGDLGVSAFPEGESIFTWIGTIEGGRGSMYEGLTYKLSLRFPMDYPFKPPVVKFETMCFHPNVDQYGNICLDILQDKWSSAYDCRTILLSIQSLLGGFVLFLGFIIDRVHHYLQKLMELRSTTGGSKDLVITLQKELQRIKETEEKAHQEIKRLQEEVSKLTKNLKKMKLESEEKDKKLETAEVHVASLQKQAADLLLEYDRVLEDNQHMQIKGYRI